MEESIYIYMYIYVDLCVCIWKVEDVSRNSVAINSINAATQLI